MWLKQDDDLKLPKLPPRRGDKEILKVFRKGFKKIGVPEHKEEPEFLKKIDLGEKTRKIEPEFYFWLCDGRLIKDLEELTQVMKDMKDDVFNFHVNDYKNDFSNWIRDIIKNEKLAQEVSKTKTKKDAYEILSGMKAEKRKLRRKRLKFELKAPPPPKIGRLEGLKEEGVEELKEEKVEALKEEKVEELEKEKPEEIEQERPEPWLSELEALEAEEEAFEKIEEVIEKPETLIPYKGKVIPEPKKLEKAVKKAPKAKVVKGVEEEVKKLREVKKVREVKRVKKKVKKPKPPTLTGIAKINKLLEESNHLLNQGDATSTRILTKKARALLKRASMPKEEKKKLNYRIVDIEAKAKLLMLSE
jgi:hypothetical protein